VLAAVSMILLRKPIAGGVLNLPGGEADVGWIGAGVAATILNLAGDATLQCLRQVRRFSAINISGTLAGSVVSVALIWYMGVSGIFLSVSCIPLFLALFAWLAVGSSDLTPGVSIRPDWRAMASMLKLGAAFMSAAALQPATFLAIRSVLSQALGLNAAGYFHATTLISSAYVSFILQSMAGDYFPRLTATISDRERTDEIVNHQAQVALVLALPIILATIGFAPLIIEVFYTSSFLPAAAILKWQVLGDILKIMLWPVGFLLLSRGSGLFFFLSELSWNATYLALIILGLGYFGVPVIGYAYVSAYIVTIVLTYAFVQRTGGVSLSSKTIAIWIVSCLLGIFTLTVSSISQTVGYVSTIATFFCSSLLLLYILRPPFADGALTRKLFQAIHLARLSLWN
jgi:O-antigen/teichoic acid export membrane protein